MPIITKNQVPTKGQKAEFELDKVALAALPFVAADAYFSDMANWKQVELVYVSPMGRQRKVVKFDATQATPVGYFFASVKAKDDFQIQYIMINDFDGGELKIPRIEFESGEFDVAIEPATPPSISSFTRTFNSAIQSYETIGVVDMGVPGAASAGINPPVLYLSSSALLDEMQQPPMPVSGEARYELDLNALGLVIPENTDYMLEIDFSNIFGTFDANSQLYVDLDQWVSYSTDWSSAGQSPIALSFNRGTASSISGILTIRVSSMYAGSASNINIDISEIRIFPV